MGVPELQSALDTAESHLDAAETNLESARTSVNDAQNRVLSLPSGTPDLTPEVTRVNVIDQRIVALTEKAAGIAQVANTIAAG